MASVACFYRKNSHFDDDEEHVYFSKMAADRGISLLCFWNME